MPLFASIALFALLWVMGIEVGFVDAKLVKEVDEIRPNINAYLN